jgi:hypothetical protein
MATRQTMDDAYRGGRIEPDLDPPKRRRYPCQAHSCPMPGTIFPGAVQGEKAEGSGICAWHYGTIATDWPRITRVLLDWAGVSYEVNEARRVLTGENASNPAAIDQAFEQAWERMQPLVVGEWDLHLKPGNIRTRKGEERPFREGYGDWAKRLEEFVGARVRDVLSIRQRRAA